MDFWDYFWLLLIFLPLAMMWGFALYDLFHRDDLGGGAKAVWLVVIVFLPFVGTFIYLTLRPRGATADERQLLAEEARGVAEGEAARRAATPSA
jgi:hypothetical protein